MSVPAHEVTVSDTIQLIDERFSSTLQALAAGNFVLWVGSGISRDRFPMLDGLIIKVLEFLRSRIDPEAPNCKYRNALIDALDMADLEQIQKDGLDLLQPVDTWDLGITKTITKRLSGQYSEFLNIRVDNEDNDFLIHEGIDIISTYADPTITPDLEHLCLAALMIEGVITDIASANWDDLIERAYADLSDKEDGLAICVASHQLQDQGTKPKLIKFHGCAASAKDNPNYFSELIVARSAQIADWGSSHKTIAIKDYLKGLIGQKRTLMLGLSAQDYNIQYLFREARDTLSWTWESDAPAYLFSEDQLGAKQDDLLENVYRAQYNGPKRATIKNGSVIRAFAKPLLLALLLQVYTEKLKRIAGRAEDLRDEVLHGCVANGIEAVRDRIAGEEPTDKAKCVEFTSAILFGMSRVRRLTVTGVLANENASYMPIGLTTVDEIDIDPDVESSGLPEAAVALSILGQGLQKDTWKLDCASPASAPRACAIVCKSETSVPIYVAASGGVAGRLFADGVINDHSSAVLIHSEAVPERLQRSPGRIGNRRSGEPGLQEVSVRDLLARDLSSDELFQEFRMETSL